MHIFYTKNMNKLYTKAKKDRIFPKKRKKQPLRYHIYMEENLTFAPKNGVFSKNYARCTKNFLIIVQKFYNEQR